MANQKTKKRNSFLISYAVMIAVAGFAAWVYIAEYKGGEEREKTKSEAAAVLPFSNDTIQEISIRSGGHEVSLKKEGPKEEPTWRVLKPYADLADKVAIDSFLGMVSGEKAGETVIEASDIGWKTYGLDQPLVEATFSSKASETATDTKRVVQVGSVPAFDGSVYVRFDQQPRVLLAASTLQAALQKDPREFRDKRFFPFATQPDFKEVEITRMGQPKLHFVLKNEVWTGEGSWPLDQNAVKSYIQTVANLKGSDVWAEDKTDAQILKTRKLDKPSIVVRMIPDEKDRPLYEVKVANLAKEETVAAAIGSSRPLVFSLYKAQIEGLSKTEDDFRDLKFPFQVKVADVHKIQLERPMGEVSLPTLIKKDSAWVLDEADRNVRENFAGRSVKPGAAERLFSDLGGLRATKLLPTTASKPKMGGKGTLRIAFLGDKGEKRLELIFSPEGEKYHVSSTLVPNRIFEIEKAQFDGLTIDVATAPLPLPTAEQPAVVSTPAAPQPKGNP